VTEALQALQRAREQLGPPLLFSIANLVLLMRVRFARTELACDEAWRSFLQEFHDKYALFRPVISKLAILDCILSLADVANRPGYVCPVISDEHKAWPLKSFLQLRCGTDSLCVVVNVQLNIVGGRHPMVEAINSDSFVPNDISLASNGTSSPHSLHNLVSPAAHFGRLLFVQASVS
jgi:DNA mismatch repair protein MSH3